MLLYLPVLRYAGVNKLLLRHNKMPLFIQSLANTLAGAVSLFLNLSPHYFHPFHFCGFPVSIAGYSVHAAHSFRSIIQINKRRDVV